ncbi:hypothetical protein NDN13_07155 [Acinetobacter sp. C32I]|uniref:hypothetical protein n=1 Tax=Acinetobacter sp. C32I TaxID=2950074 RepID=UPI0020367A7B|nr:hypothetical protein [Acinetobacter sp. C32I]USA54953.1 hypothetical protein NDN13_07155 [Acinetobacter sp. C32I]
MEKERFNIRLNEEVALITKTYEHEFRNLAESFRNQIKNLKIDSEDISKANELLKNNNESGLKRLAELNNKIQNIELEYSNTVRSESDNIKLEIQQAKSDLSKEIEKLYTEANNKIDSIKKGHADFISLVEKAGIYELTQNYDKKAKEEKKDYLFYSRATMISIIFAILTTVVVIGIPVIEHWKANPPIDTNYYTIMARLTISFMFFILAVYTSRQSAKHYECYQENHRTFLQLAALEPFMARMTHEEQMEIRKGLIPSYFNQSSEGKFSSKGDDVDLSSNMTAIVSKLIDRIPSRKEESTTTRTDNATS